MQSLDNKMLQVDFEISYNDKTKLKFKFDISKKESPVVIFGPSGAGKTTLLRCLSGLEKPDSGIIKIGKQSWFDSDTNSFVPVRNRKVGYLFQDYALFNHMTVEKNIGFGLQDLSISDKSKKIEEMLEFFNIKELRKKKPSSLSGGEKQKVALARTLATTPDLLLLDEPFSALDLPTRKQLRKEVGKLHNKLDIPIILVTHDRQEALTMGKMVVIINEGKIVQQGQVESVFNKPIDKKAAEIVGMENVFHGTVHDKSEGILKINSADVSFSAIGETEIGDKVVICIPADEITLEKSAPHATSARNRLKGKITEYEKEGPLVNIAVDCGLLINVLITNRSFKDLELATGSEVLLSIKAQSIHILQQYV